MEEKIKQLAKMLLESNKFEDKLKDKDYWIQKAAKETDFTPKEGDWISVEVSLRRISVSVYHAEYGGGKYWRNGKWSDDPFFSDYPSLIEML